MLSLNTLHYNACTIHPLQYQAGKYKIAAKSSLIGQKVAFVPFFFKDIDGKTLSLSRPRLLRSFFDGLQRSSNLEVTNERARCRGKNPAIKISFS